MDEKTEREVVRILIKALKILETELELEPEPPPLDEEAAMIEYNLEFFYETVDNTGFLIEQLRCKNCKQSYVSIQDRMLEPPGTKGCPGCQHIAKWGGGDPWNSS